MDYIQTIRKLIGNDMLMTVGCGVIIEQDNQILLQHRTDHDVWGIPGGVMEPGETFLETARNIRGNRISSGTITVIWSVFR